VTSRPRLYSSSRSSPFLVAGIEDEDEEEDDEENEEDGSLTSRP
jgi:hypothetical protein